jgi:hydroxymethylpyrimidine/phosphomethylpyrimidine kinase
VPSVALTIAGSDPSGGAGVQADLKTFHAFGVYGAAVLTTLTAQDTTGVHDVVSLDARFVGAQLDAVLGDLSVGAAKTGLIGTAALVEVIAERLRARPVPLVVDPVLMASTGRPLAEAGVLEALRDRLLPLATLVTPNLAEAEALVGRPVRDVAGMRDAARALVGRGARAALVTGGHLDGPPRDVLFTDGQLHELSAQRVAGRAHGTGCTLSAAVTAGLAAGRRLPDAVERAKRYVTRALETAVDVGHGLRPLNHLVRPDED